MLPEDGSMIIHHTHIHNVHCCSHTYIHTYTDICTFIHTYICIQVITKSENFLGVQCYLDIISKVYGWPDIVEKARTVSGCSVSSQKVFGYVESVLVSGQCLSGCPEGVFNG